MASHCSENKILIPYYDRQGSPWSGYGPSPSLLFPILSASGALAFQRRAELIPHLGAFALVAASVSTLPCDPGYHSVLTSLESHFLIGLYDIVLFCFIHSSDHSLKYFNICAWSVSLLQHVSYWEDRDFFWLVYCCSPAPKRMRSSVAQKQQYRAVSS